VSYRHSDVGKPLFANQKVRSPSRIENFPYREWRRRMLANDAKSFLQFRNRIFQPDRADCGHRHPARPASTHHDKSTATDPQFGTGRAL
jgi:hypothetical protein